MLTAQRLLAALLIAILSGCSTMQITSDYDPSASFSGLKTYDWIPDPQARTGDPRLDNPLLARRIRNAIDNQLVAHGFEKRSSNKADFLVGYHLALEKRLAVSTMNEYYGYRAGWGWRYGTTRGRVESYTYEYDEGTLILDIVDPETRQLIWRGSAQAEVSPSASAEKREKRINKAVQKILERFPPKAK